MSNLVSLCPPISAGCRDAVPARRHFLRRAGVMALALGLAMSACQDPAASGAERVPLLLNLTADQTAGAVAVRVTITGAGIGPAIVARANFVGNSATVSVDVPVGTARTALVEILDAQDAVIASGTSTFDVVAGQVSSVTVPITSANGTVQITVTIGTVTVTVTPAGSSLIVGSTRQLSAAVLDGAGAAIPGAVVEWATTNPAFATVSATGLVTAVSAGTVDIVATSRGVSGRVTLTIVPNPDSIEDPRTASGRHRQPTQ